MRNITEKTYSVGIIGTGFIARGLFGVLAQHPRLTVRSVLWREDMPQKDIPVDANLLTTDIEQFMSGIDIAIECTGDPVYAVPIVERLLGVGKPVVTMDAQLQLIAGSYFATKGVCVEAEGDQPGSLAALDRDARAMGFTPLVYGNVKGFLDTAPKQAEMEKWAKKFGIRLNQIVANTDGTKVHIEQVLVANGLGASLAGKTLLGPRAEHVEEVGIELAKLADRLGKPVADYVLAPSGGGAVFVVARHDGAATGDLQYFKLGNGPYYTLVRPFHLCYLEIPKTMMHVLERPGYHAFNNGTLPVAQVVAVAKRDLAIGETIERGIGGFDVRGEARNIADALDHVPIGLLDGARIKRDVSLGETVRFDDVELPKSRALDIWNELLYNSAYRK